MQLENYLLFQITYEQKIIYVKLDLSHIVQITKSKRHYWLFSNTDDHHFYGRFPNSTKTHQF